MNILTDELPTQVEIDGIVYDLNTDFRVGVQIMADFEDNELADFEKNYLMICRLFPVIPNNLEEATRQAIRFLDGGGDRSGEDGPAPLRLYSFTKDAKLIYAAFRQTHGINLTCENLHWWQFIALFMDLGAETTFSNLVALRKRYKEGKATTDDYRIINQLGDTFFVDEIDTRTWEEVKEDERRAALSAEYDRLEAGGL